MFEVTKTDITDHLFIPSSKVITVSPLGKEILGWSAGCLCGWYYDGGEGWYFPTHNTAERAWKGHMNRLFSSPQQEEEDAEESHDGIPTEKRADSSTRESRANVCPACGYNLESNRPESSPSRARSIAAEPTEGLLR